MLELSFNKIRDNKIRVFFTIIGIAAATAVLLVSRYYLSVGNALAESDVRKGAYTSRILFDELNIHTETYEINDNLIAEISRQYFGNDRVGTISNMNHVIGTKAEYRFSGLDYPDAGDNYTIVRIDYGKFKIGITTLVGVDPGYSTFSKALIRLVYGEEDNKGITEGRDFESDDMRKALINEYTLTYLGLSAKEVMGTTMTVFNSDISMDVEIVGVFDNEISRTYYRNEGRNPGRYYERDEYFPTNVDLIFTKDVVIDFFSDYSGEKMGPSQISITVDGLDNVQAVYDNIVSMYSYYPSSDYIMFYDDIVNTVMYEKMMKVIGALILIVASLMVAITLVMEMSEQKQYARMLALLGMKRRKIVFVFFLQGNLYGMIGTGTGALLGIVFTLLLGNMLSGRSVGNLSGVSYMLPLDECVMVCGEILGICLLISMTISAVAALIWMNEEDENECRLTEE